jgi:single-strand DNA-binding protein
MPNLNKVFLMGNLTRDPQLKYTPSQMAVCDFGLAINRKWKGNDGQMHEEVCFVDCTAWSRTAENIQKYVTKGRPLFVEGRLHYHTWDGPDGKKRSKLDVVVDSFQFIDSKGGGPGGPGGPPSGSRAPGAQAPAGAPRPGSAPSPEQKAPDYDFSQEVGEDDNTIPF